MRKHRTLIVSIILAVMTVLGIGIVAGCSSQLNDLGGVGQASPDYSLTYLNVSSFPNVTMICIHGVGFATDTRQYDSLILVPGWNAFCATKETATPNPAPSASSTNGQ
jgi:hypothetical protein